MTRAQGEILVTYIGLVVACCILVIGLMRDAAVNRAERRQRKQDESRARLVTRPSGHVTAGPQHQPLRLEPIQERIVDVIHGGRR